MDLDTIQDELFNLARGFREQGQEVMPIAFFFVPGIGLVQLPLTFEKARWRSILIQGARKLKATAIIIQTEAWIVIGGQAPTAIAAKMAGLDSLEDFPGRVEALTSFLERKDGKRRTLTTFIAADGTLGSTDTSVDLSEGNLVGLF